MTRTSEHVSFCHPDRVCDQISDAILDEYLKQDPMTRYAVEVLGGHGQVHLVGEVTSYAHVEAPTIVRRVLSECGYPEAIVNVNIASQSPQIASGVDLGGAGDQGIVWGAAYAGMVELLPKEFVLARNLTDKMGIRDGKSQVTLSENELTVVTSVCNPDEQVWHNLKLVMEPWEKKDRPILWLKNPGGEWTVGGFDADTGLTGRKLAVDCYGACGPGGGGALSGKDCTKTDRSGAIAARAAAVDILHKRGGNQVLVRIAYAIGVAEPVEATAYIDGVEEDISKIYDFRPAAIIEALDLRKPIWLDCARRGHFGRGRKWDGPGALPARIRGF